MKTMCPPGYLHNGFVATHALGHMMYSHYAHLASVRFEHSVCVCVCVCVCVGGCGWVGGCVGVCLYTVFAYLHFQVKICKSGECFSVPDYQLEQYILFN